MLQKKEKRSFFFIGFLFMLIAVLISACDMTRINDENLHNLGSGARELSEAERDLLEKNGHYLKLINLPQNTQLPNVYSVQIANSAAAIGKLNKENLIYIYREDNETSTVYMPLVYFDESTFLETGYFYTGFTIHVDAITKYIVDISDKFVSEFINGRSTVNVRNLPTYIAANIEPSYLTIYNLPEHLSVHNISQVLIHNQAGTVAYCDDYSLIDISVYEGLAVMKIPLVYNRLKTTFYETGVYYVSFDINVDVETRFLIVKEDKISVSFFKGNGFLDIRNLPENYIPTLTLQSLPLYTTKKQFSNINIFNLAGVVAECSDIDDIIIFKNNEKSTAIIPLTSGSGQDYFLDTGAFAVTFTINVDVETQISYSRADNVILQFVNGSSVLDMESHFGYFNAQLVNPDDTTAPKIKKDSIFDIDGYRHVVTSDLSINATSPFTSCILYLYAYRIGNDVNFEYSSQVPIHNPSKKGWYNGSKRALWKMVYVYEGNVGRFLFKTYIEDNFPQLNNYVISSSNNLINSSQTHFSLSGTNNPGATSVTLQPGVYIISLAGAGGGGGAGSINDGTVSGGSSGGRGGTITELLTVNKPTAFTAFTGSGGSTAPSPVVSGNFSISGYYYRILYTLQNNRPASVNIDITDRAVEVLKYSGASGGGGGGGGSGTFFTTEGYLLCAGGGGGGSGGSCLTPGGAGGAGGVIGPGAGGGAAGFLQQFFDGSSKMTATSYGGAGGGTGGGAGGQASSSSSNRNGGNALSIISSNATSSSATSASAYSSSIFDVSANIAPAIYLLTTDFSSSNPRFTEYETDALNLKNMSYMLTSSGSGGYTAYSLYSSGPSLWMNTSTAFGAAANGRSLSQTSFTGTWKSSWIGYQNNIGNPSSVESNLALSFPRTSGTNGSTGGNNRNTTRGEGATSGTAGSVTIYKIY